MITNALRLKEKMIRDLYSAGLTYLGISLDAYTPETYKIVRRNHLKRVWDHTLLALQIRNDLKLDFPRIRVSFVNSPEAKHEFEQFLEYWKDKADFVELQDYDDFLNPACNFNFTCTEPYRRVMVWASGVIGCIAWTAERYPYGHIHNGATVKDCWESQNLKDLRESFKTKSYKPMCISCYGKMATKE